MQILKEQMLSAFYRYTVMKIASRYSEAFILVPVRFCSIVA